MSGRGGEGLSWLGLAPHVMSLATHRYWRGIGGCEGTGAGRGMDIERDEETVRERRERGMERKLGGKVGGGRGSEGERESEGWI